MKLYEISQAIQTVLDDGLVFDEETGEILFDSENLDQLEMELNDKLESCGIYVKNLDAEADAIKSEMNRLKERHTRLAKKADRIRDYILYNMEQTATKKLETPRVALSTRKSSRVEILDERALPDQFMHEEIAYKPDKRALKTALKDGEVPGAVLVESNSLTIK